LSDPAPETVAREEELVALVVGIGEDGAGDVNGWWDGRGGRVW